jgi:hypothetical protein
MKTFILIMALWALYMLIGANAEAILSFLRMGVIGVLLVLFLIPTLKGLFGAVKE